MLVFLLLLSSVSGVHFTHSVNLPLLIFVLNALLSLQTKDNRFWNSDLQQDFYSRDFAEESEVQKGIRFGTGYQNFS